MPRLRVQKSGKDIVKQLHILIIGHPRLSEPLLKCGALDGGPKCRMSILRNYHVPYRYLF